MDGTPDRRGAGDDDDAWLPIGQSTRGARYGLGRKVKHDS